jgi:hypothetical protein
VSDLQLEIDALKARLAVLERGGARPPVATLSSLGVGAEPPRGWSHRDFPAANIIPPPSPTVPLHVLVGADGLPRDVREFRRVLEAVALGYGIETPGRDIPRTWITPLRDVYAARSGGANWAKALEAAGLNIPTGSDLTARQQALRSKIYELYDRVPALAKWVEKKAPTFAYHNLTVLLRQLLM